MQRFELLADEFPVASSVSLPVWSNLPCADRIITSAG